MVYYFCAFVDVSSSHSILSFTLRFTLTYSAGFSVRIRYFDHLYTIERAGAQVMKEIVQFY